MIQGSIVFNSPQQPKVKEHSISRVQFKVINGVLDYDFPQAKRAWEALEEAGFNPGELVANGLKEGHAYEVIFYQTEHPVSLDQPQIVAETKVSEGALIEYKKSDSSMQEHLMIEGEEKSASIVKYDKPDEGNYIQVVGIIRKTVSEFKDSESAASLLQEE